MTATIIVATISAGTAAYMAVFFATYQPTRLASKAMAFLLTALALDRALIAAISLLVPIRTTQAFQASVLIEAIALAAIILLVARRQLEPFP